MVCSVGEKEPGAEDDSRTGCSRALWTSLLEQGKESRFSEATCAYFIVLDVSECSRPSFLPSCTTMSHTLGWGYNRKPGTVRRFSQAWFLESVCCNVRHKVWKWWYNREMAEKKMVCIYHLVLMAQLLHWVSNIISHTDHTNFWTQKVLLTPANNFFKERKVHCADLGLGRANVLERNSSLLMNLLTLLYFCQAAGLNFLPCAEVGVCLACWKKMAS